MKKAAPLLLVLALAGTYFGVSQATSSQHEAAFRACVERFSAEEHVAARCEVAVLKSEGN